MRSCCVLVRTLSMAQQNYDTIHHKCGARVEAMLLLNPSFERAKVHDWGRSRCPRGTLQSCWLRWIAGQVEKLHIRTCIWCLTKIWDKSFVVDALSQLETEGMNKSLVEYDISLVSYVASPAHWPSHKSDSRAARPTDTLYVRVATSQSENCRTT